MARHHDRLSALDASFLALESDESPMHIGALAICEGPPPPLEELLAHVEARLPLVPRVRRRLAHSPLDRARPLWVDDPSFRLASHIHHAALPAPRGRGELHELVGRVFATRLPRDRPLWELWLVEGLHDARFALVFKSHHALIDGVSAVELAATVLDGEAPPPPPAAPAAWAPRRPPGALGLAQAAVADLLRAGTTVARAGAGALLDPGGALTDAGTALAGIGTVAAELLRPAPPTPLNVPIGPYRRFATARFPLADLRRIDGTVNDVMLTIVAGALRRFLVSRAVDPTGLELDALVPVSLRGGASQGGALELGNRISAMRAPLPVGLEDPRARLDAVRAAMSGVKESHQAQGTQALTALLELAPPQLLAQVARLPLARRLFNVVVTNVPGPQWGLHVLGRRMLEAHPIAPLPRDHALSIAILSYHGEVHVGLLADRDALPEVEEIASWLGEEVAALLAAT